MRSAVILSQLALWATTTHAFYPFTPPWALELAEKRSEETDENGLTFTLTQRNGHVGFHSVRICHESGVLTQLHSP